jgi:hypothetical protein
MGNRVKIAHPPLHFASSHASWLWAFDLKVKIVMIIIILLKGCILNNLIIDFFGHQNCFKIWGFQGIAMSSTTSYLHFIAFYIANTTYCTF